MIKFNESHIIAGYIKQLLTSINLPNVTNDGWAGINQYAYYDNKKILNYQKNYKGFTDVYDSYTHEVLGDYLRFYNYKTGINLMPLYNCFSNVICEDFEVTLVNGKVLKNDKKHKVYMLPIKLGREYTIAIDEPNTVEICCGLYDNYMLEAGKTLPGKTYKKYSGTRFNDPFIYTVLKPVDEENATASEIMRYNEIRAAVETFGDVLKMFIIVPENNTSSITVLEGNYLNYNDKRVEHFSNGLYKVHNNYSELNLFPEINGDYADTKFITNLQLLRFNTKASQPFADRLLEYLTDNVISGFDNIRDNVIRLQTVLSNEYSIVPAGNGRYKKVTVQTGEEGLWDDKFKAFIYAKMQSNIKSTFESNHDILGYVDKDVEANYNVVTSDSDGKWIRVDKNGYRVRKDPVTGAWPKGSKWKTISLNSVDIYPDIYKDSKGGE